MFNLHCEAMRPWARSHKNLMMAEGGERGCWKTPSCNKKMRTE